MRPARLLVFVIAALLSGVIEAHGAASGPAAHVVFPLPTMPVFVLRGGCFESAVAAPEETQNAWEAELLSKTGGGPVSVKTTSYNPGGKSRQLEICTSSNTPLGLHDLSISAPGAAAFSKRSVMVLSEFKTKYTFVHITDVHIGCCRKVDEYSKERTPSPAPEQGFARIADEVNALKPDFVLITGDIVTSAEAVARVQGKVYGTVAEDEFREFLNLLDRFDVPTFVVPGNHDLVGTVNKSLLDFWEREMGPRYFSFEYGGDYYLGMDNSNAMEGLGFIYKKASSKLDPGQKKWIEDDLQKNAGAKLKVFFFHVCVNKNEIEEFADKYGAQLALFGHWHKDDMKISGETPTTWVQTKSALDECGYRLVKVKDHKIISFDSDGKGASLTCSMANNKKAVH